MEISRKTEIIAGLTTFFTMSYIVVVNAAILSTEGTGIPFSGALTATVMVCFVMTLFMGLYARLPFGVAPGMGINAFFTYTIILGQQVPWQTALGMVFWSGVLFVLISVTPLREKVARSIPENLRIGVAVGIGVFLAFIGFKNAGMIVAHPATLVTIGRLDTRVLLTGLGLLVSFFLLLRKSPFAFLASIFVVTLASIPFGFVTVPEKWFSAPDFSSVFFQLDIWGALKFSLLPAIVSLFFTDLFDSLSTFIGVSHACGLVDEEGQPLRLREGLIVDSFATLGAGLFGSSAGTAYIESSAGVEMGGRTGLTAVVTAFCFLPCFFVAPIAAMVPVFATTPVLVLIGAMMFRSISKLSFGNMEDVLPAFLTIALIPLTFSITQGILWGFISHTVLYLFAGRGSENSLTMYGLAVLSVFLLAI